MATPTYFTFKGDPGTSVAPFRPGLTHLGGGAKQNESGAPPDPVTMPTAEDENQHEWLLEGLARMIPACSVSVEFTGGAPAITKLIAMSDDVVIATLTVTDNAAGDTSITWPAGTFPNRNINPRGLTINSDMTAIAGSVIEAQAVPLANGVRVRTYNKSAGAGADLNFSLDLI